MVSHQARRSMEIHLGHPASLIMNVVLSPGKEMFKRSLSAPNNASPAGHVPMPPSPSNPHSDKSPYTPGATRTNHQRTRDTPHHSISSFPMSTFDRAPASRPPQLTWQEEEDRRRYEDTHFNQWWVPRSLILIQPLSPLKAWL
ncbi:hypothetical protein BD779DRAFT_1155695 [Infundibulicybe gibba]|nr:hypothetical protein BD779DRAFT_1155695 [Infundibulicybe gibba]